MLRRLLPNVYEGWIVAGASATVLLMLSATIFYGLGPLFNPMVDEFGWSVGATSFAFSVRSEVNGVAAPFVGVMVDRLGTQRVMLAGVAVTALGVFLMSFQQELWHFYLLMFLVAIGTSTSGGQVIMVSTVTWFERRRAQALSYATAGGALGGMLVIFVSYLVEELGWRGAVRVMAVLLLVVGLAAGANVRNRPPGHPQPMDGRRRRRDADGHELDDEPEVLWGVTLRRAVTSRSFLMLSAAQATTFFALTAVIVHQVPYMESQGISSPRAAAAAGVFSLSSFVGRLASGLLADRLDKRLVFAAIVAITTAGMPLLMLVDGFWVSVPVLVMIGLGMGGANPLRTALMADYFGTTHFGAINGVAMFIGTLGAFFGPWLVGLGVDATDSYNLGWTITAVVSACSIPAVLLALPPTALIAEFRARGRVVAAEAGGRPPLDAH